MNRKGTLALLAVLFILGSYWFAVAPRGGKLEPGVAPGASTTAPPSPHSPPSPDPVIIVQSSVGPASSSTTAQKAALWTLHVRLLDIDPAVGPVQFSVEPIEETSGESAVSEPVIATADQAGSCVVDISLFFGKGLPIAEVEVSIDTPDYVPTKVRVPTARGIPGPDGATALSAEIHLERAQQVRGKVLDEAGLPVPEVAVGTFPFAGDRPLQGALDQSRTGPDGEFTIRLGSQASVLLVAAKAGFFPVSIVVYRGGTTAPMLVLRTGASVSGSVIVGSEPGAGAVVESRMIAVDLTLQLADLEIAWAPGSIVLSSQKVTADQKGRFVIGGLAPGMAHLRVDKVPGPWILEDVYSSAETDVQVPTGGLILRLSVCRLRLVVRAVGKPVPSAVVRVQGDEATTAVTTDENGCHDFLARPGANYSISVEADGLEDWEQQVVAPALGSEVTVNADLQARKPRASLILVLSPPGDQNIDRIAVALVEPGVRVRGAGSTRVISGAGNRFRVPEIEPGPRRIVVRPGGEWFGGTGYWLETEAAVEVPTEGEIVAKLAVHLGGRLRVSVRDGAGGFTRANCVLFDEAGNRVPVTFANRDAGGSLVASTGGPQGGGPSVVDPPLATGRYRLDFSKEGLDGQTVYTEVTQGQDTDLEITMANQ